MHKFPISDGEWHHIVYVNVQSYVDKGGKEIKVHGLYIDGMLSRFTRNTFEHEIKFIAFLEPIYLGAGNNVGSVEGFFNGIIDEVRIYNRPLTQEEVMNNYQSQIGLAVEHKDKLPTFWGTLKANR